MSNRANRPHRRFVFALLAALACAPVALTPTAASLISKPRIAPTAVKLSVAQPRQTIVAGSRLSIPIQVTPVGTKGVKSATGPVQLAIAALPAGFEARIRSQNTLEVWTTPRTPVGAHILKVGGRAGGQSIAPVEVTLIAQSVPVSHAYGLWTPSAFDSCSKSLHDSYSVVGPDGKLYPTWHPPTDPATGCTFGHEHGRDPRTSEIYSQTGGLPFGVANEALTAYDPDAMRHEDHVGHKVEVINNLAANNGIVCDFVTKLHMGTHSPDAFSNNLHELSYFARCTDGTQLSVIKLSAFGKPGEFVRGCDEKVFVPAASPMPMNSPLGPGARNIPDLACVNQYVLVASGQSSQFFPGVYESWDSENYIFTRGGKVLAYFNPSFSVSNPARYFDGAAPNDLAYTVDLCNKVEANGDKVQGFNSCKPLVGKPPVAYNDPASPFIGTNRTMTIIANQVSNNRGPTIWYTDPYGGNASVDPFPGSIRQTLSAIDNLATLKSIIKGVTIDYAATGVHAPN